MKALHVSDIASRASILAHGLDASRNPNHVDKEAPRSYFWERLHTAKLYAAWLATEEGAAALDIWEVNLDGIAVEDDPWLKQLPHLSEWASERAFRTAELISPARLSLLATIGFAQAVALSPPPYQSWSERLAAG